MKILLLALIVFLTLSSVFAWDPGPMTGVKIQNGILYLLIAGLLLRFALDRKFKLELPGIHLAFVVLIAYTILSYLTVVLVVHYPQYGVVENGLHLKIFIDQFLFFLAFFYGVRSQQDGIFILKCLLAAVALSHAVALMDALGLVRIGDIEQRVDGRVQGLVGESNQYGAFVALSLPALIAIAVTSRGLQRLLWMAAVALTAATLVMTVSRGAFVAVTVAGVWALFVFSRYAAPGRLFLWTGGVMAFAIVAVGAVIALGFGDLLHDRLVSDTVSTDMGTRSSGRTQIWTDALATMMREPITFLSGFGWRAYWSMPFRYSPHNHYLNQWFNLGLVGLVCSVLLFVLPIATARSAAAKASAQVRPLLIGFAIAGLTFAVATFFVDLYVPWLYFWAYAGLTMRMALSSRETSAAPESVPAQKPPDTHPFGWVAVSRNR